MSDTIGAVLLVAGGFFVFVAALGVLRLPDLFMRMHAATKAGIHSFPTRRSSDHRKSVV